MRSRQNVIITPKTKETMHKARIIIFTQLIAIMLLSGCSGYRFLSNGVIVDGDATYYNEESQIALQVFGDYTPLNRDTERGFSTTKLNRLDRKLLHKLKIPKHAKTLFSGTPDTQPFYNIVALVEQDNRGPNMPIFQDYEQFMEGDELLYYYNKSELMNKRIYHAIVPRATGNIHFLHYRDKDDERVYFDIEQLASMNSTSSPSRSISYPNTTFAAPDGSEKAVQIEIPKRKKGSDLGIVKFYDQSKRLFHGFSVIKGNQNTLTFALPPGSYRWVYTELNGQILSEDTLSIHP